MRSPTRSNTKWVYPTAPPGLTGESGGVAASLAGSAGNTGGWVVVVVDVGAVLGGVNVGVVLVAEASPVALSAQPAATTVNIVSRMIA